MKNRIKFTWPLFDSWFSSVDNMKYIKLEHEKEFIGALKNNRPVALTEEDRDNKKFIRIDQVERTEREAVSGLQSADSGSEHDHDNLSKTTERRGVPQVIEIEAALAKSPARRMNAQSNHIFAAIIRVFKMECLKIKTKINHFALKSKLCLKAVRSAFDELQQLQAA